MIDVFMYSLYWLNIGFNKKKMFCTQICVFILIVKLKQAILLSS